MPLNPLNHYSLENHATIYDEEALTVMELVARLANMFNNNVAEYNRLEKETNKHLEDQDNEIKTHFDRLTATVPSWVYNWLADHPEVTTTLQDGEIMLEKFHDTLKKKTVKDYATPQMYGAVGDGVTDDTQAFTQCFAENTVILVPEGTYSVGCITTLPGSVVTFDNATLKRNQHVEQYLITFEEGSVVYGSLTVDGDLVNATSNSEGGVMFLDGCVSYGKLTARNNSRHGFHVGSNNEHYYLVAHNNGRNGDASGNGKADGIYLSNVQNTVIHKCEAYSNKRMGVTVTTFDNNTQSVNASLTNNVVINNIVVHDNVYLDCDVEYATRVTLSGMQGGRFCCSGTAHCEFYNMDIATLYGSNTTGLRIRDIRLSPQGEASNVFYIEGSENVVENIIINDTATSYKSNTFSMIDNGFGVLRNIQIYNGHNAVVASGCKLCEGIVVMKANNRLITYDSKTIPTSWFRVDQSHLTLHYNAAPEFAPTPGDRVINTNPHVYGSAGSQYIIAEWICGPENNWQGLLSYTGT